MSDNTTLPGTGDVIADEDIAGVKHQKVIVEWGPAGTANKTDTASGKALPVQVRSATGLVPIGEPTDAKSTATDTTSVSGISIWKQISASVQALVTGLFGKGTAGTAHADVMTVQGVASMTPVAIAAAAAAIVDGAIATLGAKADAKSTATDTTAITAMQVLKQMSASLQALVTAETGVANDAAASAVDPVLIGGYASAAAPSDVSADTDAVRAWLLRNGAQVVNLSAAGALLPGDATHGLRVQHDSGSVASGAFASGSVADGAMVTLGAKADAKSTATDTTSITIMQVLKQISASIQALATAMSTNALAGEYETVAASATAQALGATGAAGDYLSHVVVVPATAGCGVVTIKDNSTTIIAFPGGGTTALPSLAPFVIPVGMYSVSGAWKIDTGANVACVAVGNFT